MRRIFYTAAALLAMLNSYGQIAGDSSGFKSRKLKIEEIDLVSSYYVQDGNNSVVRGGIGSEKLTDISNVFSIKLVKYDKQSRKNTIDLDLGIDHYTSASSDQIDLKANSSASSSDVRVYSSVNWTRENEEKGTTIGLGLSSSVEFDYTSFAGNISFSKKTKDKNGEFTAKLQTYLDQVSLIAPVELRSFSGNNEDDDYPTAARNTFSGSLSYSQIINDRLQVMLLADAVQQQGYLSLPFHRVYFTDGRVHQERLPDSRFKLPLGLRANYFLGDKIILKAYYRYYTDNWGLKSNTASLEIPVKITPFISIAPSYRFYNQTAINYFDGYKQHTNANPYYTSNYDLSGFVSHFIGTNIRLAPPRGILGWANFAVLELKYGHYLRTTGMNANIISLNLKFK